MSYFSVIGCGNPVAPVHGWADRVGNSVTMGCNDNDLSWKLTCREGAWHGKTNNCTKCRCTQNIDENNHSNDIAVLIAN